MATESDPTHAPPRVTELQFAQALWDTRSPAAPYAYQLWPIFLAHGVDPGFALGQFWAESNSGRSGWAKTTDSWGNTLWGNGGPLCTVEWTPYPGYRYTYCKYDSWPQSVEDYCWLIDAYRDRAPDARYGDTSVIYGATAKWMGKTPGSVEHLNYLSIVLGRMARYAALVPEVPDMILLDGITLTSTKRIQMEKAQTIYKAVGGDVQQAWARETSDPKSSLPFYGLVNATTWGIIVLDTARDMDGKLHRLGLYVHLSPTQLAALKPPALSVELAPHESLQAAPA